MSSGEFKGVEVNSIRPGLTRQLKPGGTLLFSCTKTWLVYILYESRSTFCAHSHDSQVSLSVSVTANDEEVRGRGEEHELWPKQRATTRVKDKERTQREKEQMRVDEIQKDWETNREEMRLKSELWESGGEKWGRGPGYDVMTETLLLMCLLKMHLDYLSEIWHT